ncbi:Vacuolar protein sorting-associated protein 41 [Lachancea thermotolerans]
MTQSDAKLSLIQESSEEHNPVGLGGQAEKGPLSQDNKKDDLDVSSNSKEENMDETKSIDRTEIRDGFASRLEGAEVSGNKDKDNAESEAVSGSGVESEDQSEEEEEDEEEEEEEEDEEPPLLNYTRITKLPKNFFTRDSISACQFHEKVFAFATHAGFLHFTETDFTTIRTFRCHRASITSIFTDGDIFATSSIDGSVVIGSVRDSAGMLACDFKRPVHAVVLDDRYKTSKTFVSGGMAGEVILSQRNWLGNRLDIILDRDNGPVVGIYTVDDVLFWMNDSGITFYSISSKTKLLQVPFPRDEQGTRPDLYWPSVHFPETDRIIVVWANHIWTFKISLTKLPQHGNHLGSILSSAASSLRAAPDKKIDQEHYLYVNTVLAGVVSFKNDQLLCLEVPPSKTVKNKSELPRFKVIDMFSGLEIHSDEVVSKSYQNLTVKDYHLGKHIGKGATEYYMISAKDAVSAHELSLKERFDWFSNTGHDYEAWKIGLYAVDKSARLEAGKRHINKTVSQENWKEAAKSITEVFSDAHDDRKDDYFEAHVIKDWGNYILLLLEREQANVIVDLIPTEPPLDNQVYDATLNYYLKANQISNFSKYLRLWPKNLFSLGAFCEKLEEVIEQDPENSADYRKDLVFLLIENGNDVKVIPHLIKLKDQRALDIIRRRKLLSMFSNQLVEILLLPFNGSAKELSSLDLRDAVKVFQKPVELLVEGAHMIGVNSIIPKLSSPRELRLLLFLFFRKASSVNSLMIAPYEDDMLELYYEYDKTHLLDFLRSKNDYNIDKAIDLCASDENCFNELIYLWGKVGETRKALSLIIDKKNDPQLAIEFVKGSGDSELWEYLVTYSMNKPSFIEKLLDPRADIGTAYPEVVKRVPEKMDITGLKVSLENVTKENFLSLNVGTGVFKIIDDETNQLAHEFLNLRDMGKPFEVNNA